MFDDFEFESAQVKALILIFSKNQSVAIVEFVISSRALNLSTSETLHNTESQRLKYTPIQSKSHHIQQFIGDVESKLKNH